MSTDQKWPYVQPMYDDLQQWRWAREILTGEEILHCDSSWHRTRREREVRMANAIEFLLDELVDAVGQIIALHREIDDMRSEW